MPKVKSYLNHKLVFAVDVANNVAGIPGTGDVPIVFTHTFDVAKFVAALVGVPDWPERSTVIGDKKSWNEFVAIAEEVKGEYIFPSIHIYIYTDVRPLFESVLTTIRFLMAGVKFNVTHDSEELLKSSKITELPSHAESYSFLPKEKLQAVLSAFGRWTIAGDFNMPEEGSLNQRFPEIKPRSIRDVLQEGWGV
jgi:hypothetical protein